MEVPQQAWVWLVDSRVQSPGTSETGTLSPALQVGVSWGVSSGPAGGQGGKGAPSPGPGLGPPLAATACLSPSWDLPCPARAPEIISRQSLQSQGCFEALDGP